MSKTKCTFTSDESRRWCITLGLGTLRDVAAAIDGDFDPLEDFVGRAHGIDGDEDAFEAVVVEQRRRLLAIDFHAVGDRMRIVIGSALDGGTPEHAGDQLVFVGPQFQRHAQRRATLLQRLIQRAGLLKRARASLHERFVHFLGQPPMQYLTQWRMQLASGLLRDTNAKLIDVALDVGYESEAAFSRAFKRVAGVSPGAWRKLKREKPETEIEAVAAV